MKKHVYEAPKAEIVLMDANFGVLMASAPVPTDSGIMGNGMQFTEDQGQW